MTAKIDLSALLAGLDRPVVPCDGAVGAFLEHYQGSANQPVPFVGRKSELAEWTRWLDDPTAPQRASLVAPAGRGKSATIVRWLEALHERADLAIAYLPVSQRFGTNHDGVIWAALFARLSHLHGIASVGPTTIAEHRAVVVDLIARPLPDTRRLLLIIDGLDEAANGQVWTDWLAGETPPTTKILVAARQIAGNVDWAARLNWGGARTALTFNLDTLAPEAMREAVYGLLPVQPGEQTLSRLYALTDGGDPFLLRLYIERLREQGEHALRTAPSTAQPGLAAFFDGWFEDQEALWQLSADRPDRADIDTLFAILAQALGPLSATDLHALEPRWHMDPARLHRTVVAVGRFVVGAGTAGSGYVFSHPRLADYFTSRLSDSDRLSWQTRFVDYGRATVSALEAGQLSPRDAPAYVIRNYRLHLLASAAPPAETYRLLIEPWLRAWEALEGTEAGFLNDARAVLDLARHDTTPASLGSAVRAMLCLSSALTQSRQFGAGALRRAVQRGVMTWPLAVHYARTSQDPMTLAELSALAPTPNEQDKLRDEARAIIGKEDDPNHRLQGLVGIIKRIAAERCGPVLQEVGNLLPYVRLGTIVNILRQTPSVDALLATHRARLLPRWIENSRGLRDPLERRALVQIAAGLPYHEARPFLIEAITRDTHTEGEPNLTTLGLIARQTTPDDDELLRALVASVAERLREGSKQDFGLIRMDLLSKLSPLSPLAMQAALQMVETTPSPKWRAQVWATLAAHQPAAEREALLTKACTAIRSLDTPLDRSRELADLAHAFPEERRRDLLAAALREARVDRSDHQAVWQLLSIAPHLSAQAARLIYLNAFRFVESQAIDVTPHILLSPLAAANHKHRFISPERIRDLVERVRDPNLRYEQLAMWAVDQVKADPQNWLRYIGLIRQLPAGSRAWRLLDVADCLPDYEAVALVDEALRDMRLISDSAPATLALAHLTNVLDEREANHRWQAILAHTLSLAVSVRRHEAEALARIAPESIAPSFWALTVADIDVKEAGARAAIEHLAAVLPLQETEAWGTLLQKAAIVVSVEKDLPTAMVTKLCRHGQGLTPSAWHRLRDSVWSRWERDASRQPDFAVGALDLIPFLAPDEVRAVTDAGLERTRRQDNAYSKRGLLLRIARALPLDEAGAAYAEAITLARDDLSQSRTDSSPLIEALLSFAKRLPAAEAAPYLEEAARLLETQASEPWNWWRLDEFLALMPEAWHVPLLERALQVARQDQDHRISQQDLILRILKHLPSAKTKALIDELLTSAAEFLDEDWELRGWRLTSIAELVSDDDEDTLVKLWLLAFARPGREGNPDVFPTFSARWPAMAAGLGRSEHKLLIDALAAMATCQRPYLLAALGGLAPLLQRLGGDQAVRDTMEAIQATTAWWP